MANILVYLYYFSLSITIFFIIKKKENFKITTLKILIILLFVSIISDLLSRFLQYAKQPSTIIVNMYTIAEFLILSHIYQYLLRKKKLVYVALILFSVLFLIITLYLEPFTEFQSWACATESIIVIIYSIIYFIQLLDSPPTRNLFKHFSFWFNLAIFYYFSASFLLFFSRNYIFKTQSLEFTNMIWGFHNLNNIIKNILFAIAISYAGVKHEEVKDIEI